LLVRQFSVAGQPVVLDLSVNWQLLGFTAVLALTVALLFGIAPALSATRVPPVDTLVVRHRIAARKKAWGLGGALVGAQVALCLTLVVAAGLFGRTFASLTGRDRGFDTARVLLTDIDARRIARPSTERLVLYERMIETVRSLPGVSGAALSVVTPVSDTEWDTLIRNPPGLSLPESERVVMQNFVSPGWFEVYGIRFVAGRDFIQSDISESSNVAIINQTMARRYFEGGNPVGRTIQETGSPGEPRQPLTIVGIVKDSVYLSLREEPRPPCTGQSRRARCSR
jgi:hypothetical protein